MAKILVYGAGPLGSLFAARLQQGGNDVSILARGQRLADLRAHGIVLRDALTGKQWVTPVRAVERLDPGDTAGARGERGHPPPLGRRAAHPGRAGGDVGWRHTADQTPAHPVIVTQHSSALSF